MLRCKSRLGAIMVRACYDRRSFHGPDLDNYLPFNSFCWGLASTSWRASFSSSRMPGQASIPLHHEPANNSGLRAPSDGARAAPRQPPAISLRLSAGRPQLRWQDSRTTFGQNRYPA